MKFMIPRKISILPQLWNSHIEHLWDKIILIIQEKIFFNKYEHGAENAFTLIINSLYAFIQKSQTNRSIC